MEELLEKVRLALRIVSNDFDGEITDLINACLKDLGISGVINTESAEMLTDALIVRAVITYCRANFGDAMGDYERLKASYDEQKAQLMSATGYTDWLGVDNE